MLMGMNCGDEKMLVISSNSTNNEWPQQNYNDNNNNINHMISSTNDHHQKPLIATTKNMASSSSSTMDQKPPQDNHNHDHNHQQQQALRCPRCDSSNTKFCYYNNYSLSQPRHFCKACKRYWTRGGTLRNVPVGGGCRKNKRIRRPATNSNSSNSTSLNSSSSSSNLTAAAINNSHSSTNSHSQQQPPQIDLLSAGHGSHIASLFYNHDVSLPPNFSRYDHHHHHHNLVQPQLNSLGLGFSNSDNGLINNSSNSLLSSYASIFGAAAASSPPPTTIASLLASKFTNGGGLKDHQLSGTFNALTPFEELSIAGVSGGHEVMSNNNKQVKLELDGQGRSALGWINGGDHHQNQTDQIGLSSSSEPSLYWTNPTAVVGGAGGNWLDPTANIGSNSVPSLI